MHLQRSRISLYGAFDMSSDKAPTFFFAQFAYATSSHKNNLPAHPCDKYAKRLIRVKSFFIFHFTHIFFRQSLSICFLQKSPQSRLNWGFLS